MHNILQIISILCITETVGQQLHISNTVGWLIIVYNNYSGRKQYTTQNSIQEKMLKYNFFQAQPSYQNESKKGILKNILNEILIIIF